MYYLTIEECHNALGLAMNLCTTRIHGVQPYLERHKIYQGFNTKYFTDLTFQMNRIIVMKARGRGMAIVRLVCLPKIP